jgi:glycosyltransferase involved in cell wall biosynthesis
MVGYGKKAIVDELRCRIEQKGLSKNVELIGFRRSSGVYELMKQSKLFLYADTENGWGIAVAEAMASKCVVIAYDLPVYKEVFRDAIIYVPLRNLEKFTEAVLTMLSNEKLVHKMAERSRVFVTKYDWDPIALGELRNISSVVSYVDHNNNLRTNNAGH